MPLQYETNPHPSTVFMVTQDRYANVKSSILIINYNI